MAATAVVLIRHGETIWNLEGRYQGQFDSPLTREGRRQVRALASRLRHYPFDHLYASDLGRAWQTAERIAAATGHAVIAEPRLRERHFGLFHGLDQGALQRQYPEEYKRYATGDPDYAIPGGESLRQLHERAVACLEELAARHAGERLVLVTHGGVLAALVRHVLGLPLALSRPFRVFNASFNLISHADGRWLLETLGDISHLQGPVGVDDLVE